MDDSDVMRAACVVLGLYAALLTYLAAFGMLL